MEFSQTTKEIFGALNTFRKNLKQPEKTAKNPFFSSNYVPLEGVVSSIDKAIGETGLSYMQNTLTTEGGICVQTIITHVSGEFIVCDPMMMPVSSKKPQEVGSALTYCRRYSLSSAFGICSDFDDDGNAANGNDPNKIKKQQTKKSSTDKTETKITDKTHVQVAKRKIKTLADKQGISTEEAEKAILSHYGVKGSLEAATTEQITNILNYLKKAENS